MKKYFSYQDTNPPMSPGLIGNLFRTIQETRTASKNDDAVLSRIDELLGALHYFDLNYRMVRETNPAKKAAMKAQVSELMYRERYTYMNHWAAYQFLELQEQTMAADAPRPWQNKKPITREETEKWLQDALAYYPKLKIPAEIKFSKELEAVDFGVPGIASSQTYQEGSTYLIWSKNSEPIKIKFETGTPFGWDKHEYQITDETGKVLKTGRPKPGVVVELTGLRLHREFTILATTITAVWAPCFGTLIKSWRCHWANTLFAE